MSLFPFDGSRRLRGDIVGDSGDTFDFVDDSRSNLLQEFVWEWEPISSHEIGGFDGSQGDDLFTGLSDFFNVDMVSGSSNGDLRSGNLTENSDGDTWTWEWVSPDQIVWDPHDFTQFSDFVLEQFTQWFNQLQLHVV
ncbi:hypothetical protein WICPIJ_007735 [Wickerhamomyces pijperi]|uniref:Uncharacterized protein n=1 Tax=Wickerhamomyces pijperi TaxID=599730 RepID=A0A9P8TJM6_WICPI|nr:hypothetical protein WICPIJ_007735 [Wickerhamomyces pijperi]